MKSFVYDVNGEIQAVVFPVQDRLYLLTPTRMARLKEGVEDKLIERGFREAEIEPIGTSYREILDRTMQMYFVEENIALDGCRVEDDGKCPHGYPSWVRFLIG